jgi:toxin CptA
MHNAPSVDFPVGRSRFEACTIGAVSSLGAAATAAWAVQAPAGNAGPGWAAVLLAVAFVLAVRAWWRTPAGWLVWRGARWRWQPGGRHASSLVKTDGLLSGVSTVSVALDLQRHLLARLDAPGERPRWLWLSKGMAPQHWDDLRRAVYSRASAPVLPDTPVRAEAPTAAP